MQWVSVDGHTTATAGYVDVLSAVLARFVQKPWQ